MRNSWIQLQGGHVIDPLDPDPDLIFLEDIAHALALQCRYTGHTSTFYSVAEHSVRASRYVDDAYYAKWVLLHDASEAYIGDLASPLKVDPAFGQSFRGAEKRLMRAICEAFGLDSREPEVVHEVDMRMLATEVRDLMQPINEEIWDPWILGVEPFEKHIEPWGWKRAKGEFLSRYARLERQLRREERNAA